MSKELENLSLELLDRLACLEKLESKLLPLRTDIDQILSSANHLAEGLDALKDRMKTLTKEMGEIQSALEDLQ